MVDLADWLRRWENNQIGFHEAKPNPLLVAHMDLLRDRPRILVPLAGKSVDMLVLAAAGHHVVGVEGAEIACDAFFAENHIAARRIGNRYRAPHIEMVCANFFDVDGLGSFDGAWDRAAFIAVLPQDRPRYADVVARLLRPRARLLLAAFAYDQKKADGPPWSVDRDDVMQHFGRRGFVMEPVASRVVTTNPRLRAAGIEDAREELLLLTRLG